MNIRTKTASATVALLGAVSAVALFAAAPAIANTLYFQMNPNLDQGGSPARQIFLFGPANATGTITGPGVSETFDLGAEGFVVVNLPLAAELAANIVEAKGFRVDSAQAISGYYLNRRNASTDMTYLIDGDRLGTDYFALGYQNLYQDQVSAQAVHDNTTVTFTQPDGTSVTQTLNAGETYMLTANRQLTGTRILSDKPITVFSGNYCTNVPTGVTACDHIVEQMPPTDALSSSYLLAQTVRTGTLGNVMRVVATADNTEIRVNGDLVATLNAGQFYEGRVAGAGVELVATNPVLVGQYLIGQTQAGGANTDPALTIVPGQDQWLSSYVFAPPLGSAAFPTDYIQIIIGSSDIDTLLLDGVGIDSSLFSVLGSTAYSFGNIDVSDKITRFTIEAANPFQLLLMGFDSYDSYFTYGGAAFAPGASPVDPTPPPPPPPGESVWWDGDAAGNVNNGIVDGGDGVLTAASPNLTEADGDANGPLPANPVHVIFAGAAGHVQVDASLGVIQLAGMDFRTSGYLLSGDGITLAGAAPDIIVGSGDPLTAAHVTTIDSAISGTDGLVKKGLGTLMLTGTNGYAGGTTVTQGTLVGHSGAFGSGAIVNNAALIFDQAANGSFGAGISGTGSLEKRGDGQLILTGINMLSGPTAISAGRLQVDGSLAASAVTVHGGGILGGNGVVGATMVEAGGRVAPGASIGTLNIVGDFVQAAGSFHDAELLSTGQSDLIAVTGTASIESGAVLNVSKLDSARYVLGTRYTVLTATNGRSGNYLLTGHTRVSAFIDVVDSYGANAVWLDVTQTRAFADAALTPNQMAAATGADNSGNGSLYTAIAYLQTDNAAQYAFDQISGELHASVRGATMEDSRFIREAMINRTIDGAVEPVKGIWLHGYGSWGKFDGDGNAANVKRNLGGFFIGGEMASDTGLVAGVAAGYGEAQIRTHARAFGKADTKDVHLGGYVGYRVGPISVRGGLAQMWRKVKSYRAVGFSGFSDSLHGRYNNNLFQAFADGGYRFDFGTAGIEPFAQLAYVSVGGSRFNERGGGAALSSRTSGEDFLITQLGARFDVGLGTGGLGLTGSAGWRHLASGDRDTPIDVNLAAGPAFSIAGAPHAKDTMALALAVTGKVAGNIEVDAGYSGTMGSGHSDHGVRAAITYRF